MKEADYRFEYQEDPSQKDEHVLFEGINEEAFIKKKMNPIRSFGIFVKNNAGIVIGGLKGVTYYGCLYADMLWLKEELRHKGFGTKLMREAERIGLERNCTFATVNTMDWEALPFYQKLGYKIEFEREGFDNQSKMYFLRKKL